MQKSFLQTQNLQVGYRRSRKAYQVISSDLDLNLKSGEMACLLGPNGAGKSTLLRTLAGMQAPLQGRILLLSADLHRLNACEKARILAVVLTERPHLGSMRVQEVVALGRYPYTNSLGTLNAHDKEKVQWAIRITGILELKERNFLELSDGERQKVMIARALAQECKVMILDEPTAFLDLPRRVEIIHLLRKLAHETKCAILLSTHDLDLAMRSADTLWLLGPDGKLCVGQPEDLALNGAFAQTFSTNGVEFDRKSGAFLTQKEYCGEAILISKDIHSPDLEATRMWTTRALERLGYKIVEQSSAESLQVEMSLNPQGQWRWHTLWQGQNREHAQFKNFILYLEQKN